MQWAARNIKTNAPNRRPIAEYAMNRDVVKSPKAERPEMPSPVRRKTTAPTTEGNNRADQNVRLAVVRSLEVDIWVLLTVSSLIASSADNLHTNKTTRPVIKPG